MEGYSTSSTLHPTFGRRFLRWKEVFSALGAEVTTPSGDGYVIEVRIGSRATTFSCEALPLNSAASHLLARDKLAAYQVLERNGLRVPRGVAFFGAANHNRSTHVEPERLVSNLEETARRRLGTGFGAGRFIVKPARESHGLGVHACSTISEISEAAHDVLHYGRCGLLQEYVPGPEFRVMLLDAELLGCYRKRNPVLTGDGKRTEHELLEAFNAQCRLDPTEPPALDLDDLPPLEGRAWDLGRIPPEGEMLELALDIHNLSQGAWPEITEIDDHVLAACLESSRVLGLRFSGVDVRTPDGPFNPVIIEVNGNPGFEYLGRSAPSTVRVIIEKLASRILEDMAE